MRGAILFARLGSNIVGTVALKREDAVTFELTKMAVDERWQGRGLGRCLLESACRLARARGAARVLLYSHRSLEPAIKLYHAQGFVEQPLGTSRYLRSNIKMLFELPTPVSPKVFA